MLFLGEVGEPAVPAAPALREAALDTDEELRALAADAAAMPAECGSDRPRSGVTDRV